MERSLPQAATKQPNRASRSRSAGRSSYGTAPFHQVPWPSLPAACAVLSGGSGHAATPLKRRKPHRESLRNRSQSKFRTVLGRIPNCGGGCLARMRGTDLK